MSDKKPITVALAGNPNCGKTTIFNALTGANQHVGNYSGVTVEKRDGAYKHNGAEYKVIDLPGTYSLSYHSPEEKVAQDELLSGNIDLLVAIVDSGCLSRSLVFVAQMMQLDLPMILCLNMWDEAEKAGLELDISAMSKLMGMPIIRTVGSHKRGISELKDAIEKYADIKAPVDHLNLGDHANHAIASIKAQLPAGTTHSDWTATKLLIDDIKFVESVSSQEGGLKSVTTAKAERDHIVSDTKQDIKSYVTEQYYGFVDGLLKEVTIKKQRADARALSDKIDKVLAHPVLGLIFFVVIVYALFQLTFTLGQYPMDWIEGGFGALGELLSGGSFEANYPKLYSLIVDGIIGGVGGVVVFLPNIIILFLGLSFLEDTGYMARTAFLLDKFMHKIGLHGRSFIPLITGFGCSVPGMMATRTIAGEKERLTTMFVLPFMSCGARVPIWLLLVPVFFAPQYQGAAMFGIYMLGVLVAFAVAFCLRKTVFKGEEEPFVMELPPYRMPTLRAVLMHMWERSWLYLKKAGTIILAITIVFWALAAFPELDEEAEEKYTAEISAEIAQTQPDVKAAYERYMSEKGLESFPESSAFDARIAEQLEALELDDEAAEEKAEELTEALKASDPALYADKERYDAAAEYQTAIDHYLTDKRLEDSYLGKIGHLIAPVFKPLGFDWKVSTAVLGALTAKEVFVSQMGVVYSLGDEVDAEAEDDAGAATLRDKLRAQYSTLTGICLIIFMLLTSPCFASLAVAKRESNSWKFALAQFFGMFAIAWILAAVIHLIGSLAGLDVVSACVNVLSGLF